MTDPTPALDEGAPKKKTRPRTYAPSTLAALLADVIQLIAHDGHLVRDVGAIGFWTTPTSPVYRHPESTRLYFHVDAPFDAIVAGLRRELAAVQREGHYERAAERHRLTEESEARRDELLRRRNAALAAESWPAWRWIPAPSRKVAHLFWGPCWRWSLCMRLDLGDEMVMDLAPEHGSEGTARPQCQECLRYYLERGSNPYQGPGRYEDEAELTYAEACAGTVFRLERHERRGEYWGAVEGSHRWQPRAPFVPGAVVAPPPQFEERRSAKRSPIRRAS